MTITTLDIIDLYVKLPIQGIIKAANFWLNKNINDKKLIKKILHMLQTIMKQNFQYYDKFFQPEKSIAMGSTISSTMAEVYLLYIEETCMKLWLDSKEVIYYKNMWMIL